MIWNGRLDERPTGAGFFEVGYTPETNLRASTSIHYLHPARAAETGPRVFTGLRAVRVILDEKHAPVRENPKNPYPELGRDCTRRPIRATGVGVRDGEGRELEFRASAEVILCCGAIDSPRLLQLSGIGPRR